MAVEVENLTLSYGGFTAVRDLSLTIDDGKALVLLGQSGCGKTSTMRCIAGLEQPSNGMIRIDDKVVFDGAKAKIVPPNKRNVGMVFQSYAVWPHKTVLENVMFPLRVKNYSQQAARAKALQVLELVGLAHLAERGSSMLSGGQMQRVALARSLAMEPSVLLLDEPLSNLDARLRDDLRVELRRIQQESGLTSLYVTHDQQEALALADEIAIMQDGRIAQLASPIEMYRQPASASIAKFLGVSNVLEVAEIDRATSSVITNSGNRLLVDLSSVQSGAHSVCIRPEVIEVQSASESLTGDNAFIGTIVVAVYQGSTMRYQVQVDQGPELEAIVAATPSQMFGAGDRVRIRIQRESLQVLPNDVSNASVTEREEVAV